MQPGDAHQGRGRLARPAPYDPVEVTPAAPELRGEGADGRRALLDPLQGAYAQWCRCVVRLGPGAEPAGDESSAVRHRRLGQPVRELGATRQLGEADRPIGEVRHLGSEDHRGDRPREVHLDALGRADQGRATVAGLGSDDEAVGRGDERLITETHPVRIAERDHQQHSGGGELEVDLADPDVARRCAGSPSPWADSTTSRRRRPASDSRTAGPVRRAARRRERRPGRRRPPRRSGSSRPAPTGPRPAGPPPSPPRWRS